VERYASKMTPDDIRMYVGRDPQLLVEIGCNDGEDTTAFLDAFPECRIVAFEPDPRAIKKFKSRIDDPRCELVEAAISDEIGTTTLFMSAGDKRFVDPEWDKSSSICQPTRHLIRSPEITFPEDESHRRSVVTLTLDAWWCQWKEDFGDQPIDLIWCDPQGAQAKIIRCGMEALTNTRWLYVEYYNHPLYEGEPRLSEIAKMLEDWVLVATYEHQENALFRNSRFA